MPYQGFSEAFLKSIIAESFKTSTPGRWNITRHYMYSRLQRMLQPHDRVGKNCLAISHSSFLASLLGLEQAHIIQADYPAHNMLCFDFPTDGFDFCVSDQVLEHIEGNPYTAFEESVRVTKKGGFIAHTTCFMNEIHNTPKDFWRFTPDALSMMAEHCGAAVIDSGGWGNKDVWTFMELGFRTMPVPTDPSHPICQMAMKKDDTIPIVTWVIAQKK